MRKYLLLIISAVLMCVSCEKLEKDESILPEQETEIDDDGNDNEGNGDEDGNDEGNWGDNGIADASTFREGLRTGSKRQPFISSDFCSGGALSEFDVSFFTSEVWIAGYIVGYVNGSSISSAVFEAGSKETNIILADYPDVTDCNMVMPVQLSKDSKSKQEVREMLNLSSHPENLGKLDEVCGTIDTYMRVKGLKSTTNAIFIE